MIVFDGQSLQNRLEGISPLCRRVFALSCAERLFPLYELYSKKEVQAAPNLLHSTLDHLWESTMRGEANYEEPFLNEYESLIPGEDAEWKPLNPLAENAVAALTYACQSGKLRMQNVLLYNAMKLWTTSHILQEVLNSKGLKRK